MTLYLKLGGRTAIRQALPRLRMRLEDDPCFDVSGLRDEFENPGDLCEFLVFLSGGAPFYDGRPIADLLSPICQCNDVYERFVDHLVCALTGSAAAIEDEGELRELMMRLRPHVLDPKPVAPILVYAVEPDPLCA